MTRALRSAGRSRGINSSRRGRDRQLRLELELGAQCSTASRAERLADVSAAASEWLIGPTRERAPAVTGPIDGPQTSLWSIPWSKGPEASPVVAATGPVASKVEARRHNRLATQALAWNRLAREISVSLWETLHASPMLIDFLNGLREEAEFQPAGDDTTAELLVLLARLRPHAGLRAEVAFEAEGHVRLFNSAVQHGTGQTEVRLGRRLAREVKKGNRPLFESWPGRIDAVTVITCNRPQVLEAALQSHLSNLRAFGREYVELTILDDSGPGALALNREIIDRFRASTGIRIHHIDPQLKTRMREALQPRESTTGIPADRLNEVFDAMLGAFGPDGVWRSSAAAQRNWAMLLGAGQELLLFDDDASPNVWEASVESLMAAASSAVRSGTVCSAGERVFPGDLIEDRLTGVDLARRPIDLLGRFEGRGPALESAEYSGHVDRRASLFFERFFEVSESSIGLLDTRLPVTRVSLRSSASNRRRKLRGAVLHAARGLLGVVLSMWNRRNEDFSLSEIQNLTSGGQLEPGEAEDIPMAHERGPRFTGPFRAHCEEQEGNLLNQLLGSLSSRYGATNPGPVDPRRFLEKGMALLSTELLAELEDSPLPGQIFEDGLAYHRRAKLHLAELQHLESEVAALDQAEAPLDESLAQRWFEDPAIARSALLRQAMEATSDRMPPPDEVLLEAAQVLIPNGLFPDLVIEAMRARWRAWTPEERALASAVLQREARRMIEHLPSSSEAEADRRTAHTPREMLEGLRRKMGETEDLLRDIETQLHVGSDEDGRLTGNLEEARERFSNALRERIHHGLELFVMGIPAFYELQRRLYRLTWIAF